MEFGDGNNSCIWMGWIFCSCADEGLASAAVNKKGGSDEAGGGDGPLLASVARLPCPFPRGEPASGRRTASRWITLLGVSFRLGFDLAELAILKERLVLPFQRVALFRRVPEPFPAFLLAAGPTPGLGLARHIFSAVPLVHILVAVVEEADAGAAAAAAGLGRPRGAAALSGTFQQSPVPIQALDGIAVIAAVVAVFREAAEAVLLAILEGSVRGFIFDVAAALWAVGGTAFLERAGDWLAVVPHTHDAGLIRHIAMIALVLVAVALGKIFVLRVELATAAEVGSAAIAPMAELRLPRRSQAFDLAAPALARVAFIGVADLAFALEAAFRDAST